MTLEPAVAAAYGKDADLLLTIATEHYGVGRALLLLWLRRVELDDIDTSRLLAIASGENDRCAEGRGCLVWLMSRESADIGVANTLLSVLMRSVVERSTWPAYLLAEIPSFLTRCAASEHDTVVGETISLLDAAAQEELLGDVLTASAGSALVTQLRQRLATVADEDELSALKNISKAFGELKTRIAIDARVVQQVSLDVELIADTLPTNAVTTKALIQHLRQRALFADALQRAIARRAPLQTLRVIGDAVPSHVVEAVAAFGEAVVNTLGQYRDSDSRFRRIEFQSALAASTPIHIAFPGRDGATAFQTIASLIARSRAQLAQREQELPPTVVAAFLRLVALVREYNVNLEFLLSDPERLDVQAVALSADWLNGARVGSLEKDARMAARDWPMRVDGKDVPQANTVEEVLQTVDAIIQNGDVTIGDVDNLGAPRQLAYYKQGARVLGLLDEDNRPTDRARALVGLPRSRKLALLAVYFEDTAIVKAWRRWSGKTSLVDIDPTTAQDFIAKTVAGLTGTTIGRRASTLRRWHSELVGHHPASTDSPRDE